MIKKINLTVEFQKLCIKYLWYIYRVGQSVFPVCYSSRMKRQNYVLILYAGFLFFYPL